MKAKNLLLSIITIAALSSCSQDDTVVGPAGSARKYSLAAVSNKLQVGDWAKYQKFELDRNNAIISSSKAYFTRTVLSVNETIGEITGVTKVIDSVFAADGSLSYTEINYFTVDNGRLMMLNYGRHIARHIGTSDFRTEIKTFTMLGVVNNSFFNNTLFQSSVLFGNDGAFLNYEMTGKYAEKATVSPAGTSLNYNCYKTNWTIKDGISVEADIPVEFALGGLEADLPVEFGLGGLEADIPVEFVVVREKISTVVTADRVIPGAQYELIGFRRGH